MKNSHLLFPLSVVLFCSCFQQKDNNNYDDFNYDSEPRYEDGNTRQKTSINTNSSNSRIKGYPIKSKQFGMTFAVMPIPRSWKTVNNKKENILFEGPDGVKVYGEHFKTHNYSNNQEQNYFAKQGGSNVQPVKSIERVIQEDLKPYAASQGIRLVNQFPLPELAKADKRFDSYLFKSTPENKQYQCVATEWEDKNGGKSLGIIRYFITQYNTIGALDWGYTLNAIGATKESYEQAKKDYINALVNLQVNPQWVKANNQHYAQLSKQSNAGHQQRMAAISRQGQAIRNTGNTYSSMSDDSHESWKRRNGMSDAGQSKSVNGIWERSTVSNPNTGQSYQVEGQNSYYYGNNTNEYIGTDNALYNPNTDNSMNNQDWTQYEIEN